MRIEACKFGSMTVNGTEYTNDLIILPDRVRADWWRKSGHRLETEDLAEVFDARPEVIVIGNGMSEMMTVPHSTIKALKEEDIEVIIKDTGRAWKFYNGKIETGRKTAGAFHLTC